MESPAKIPSVIGQMLKRESEGPRRGTGTVLVGTTVGLSARALLKGQLSWFKGRGWNVVLVSSPDSDAECARARENVSFFGVRMKREIAPLNDFRALLEWIRLLRKVKPDVTNLGTPKASLLGGIAAFINRVPRRIYTVRGLRLEGSTGFTSILLWFVEKLTISLSTDIVAISHSLGRELVRRRLVKANRVVVIGQGSSNGVDAVAIGSRTADIDRSELRERLGIEPDRFIVGYIGRITKDKGVETLFDALASSALNKGVEVLAIGGIEEPQLEERVRTLGDRVHIVTWTDQVWDFLPAIDVLCLPTRREGFGNVVIEAAAAGIPSIVTRVTGAMDTVIDGETGLLVDVDDVGALVEKINLLEANRTLVASLGLAARTRVRQHFKPENIWLGLESIMEGRRGHPEIRTVEQLSRIEMKR